MYEIAVLTGCESHGLFKVPGEVALVCESRCIGSFCDLMTLFQKRLGFSQSHLIEIGMRGKPGLSAKDPDKMKGAEIGDGGEFLQGKIIIVMRLDIIFGHSYRGRFMTCFMQNRGIVGMAGNKFGKR